MQLPVLAALSGAQFMVTLDKVEYNGFARPLNGPAYVWVNV